MTHNRIYTAVGYVHMKAYVCSQGVLKPQQISTVYKLLLWLKQHMNSYNL